MNKTEKQNRLQETTHVTLGYFIARLAEEIALNKNSSQCDMCVIGSCDSQVSGMTCLNGISTWLWQQAGAFASDKRERECTYFTYLDSLTASQLKDAVTLMNYRFPHFKMNVCGAQTIIDEWKLQKERGLA